ncbi:hypothetical protein X797_010077 [Metarhizium robertsii]|uniref:F-box domain-containing protein n=1 Tax=Metarhizium robertsii TaxID=568076 RepID=A0A0A1UNJ4_9HYPO|nr:hypothetical protein X797_010077 [Metarhizium robertsii]
MGASLKSMFNISFQHNHPATGMPSSAKPPSLAPCHEPSNEEKQCDQEGTHAASPTEKPSKVSFLSLPTEIHLEISSHLIYPDALSLKHASRYFYNIINTGIELKIDWLISRRKLHLECPNNKGCDLGSDLRFCRGSVALLMKRRREHIECDSRPGIGCIIYGTPTCSHREKRQNRWKTGLQTKFTVELWWILLALLSVFIARGWVLVSASRWDRSDEERQY